MAPALTQVERDSALAVLQERRLAGELLDVGGEFAEWVRRRGGALVAVAYSWVELLRSQQVYGPGGQHDSLALVLVLVLVVGMLHTSVEARVGALWAVTLLVAGTAEVAVEWDFARERCRPCCSERAFGLGGARRRGDLYCRRRRSGRGERWTLKPTSVQNQYHGPGTNGEQ